MARWGERGWKNSGWRRSGRKKIHNREEWKEAPDNGKESSHSAHANGMNECAYEFVNIQLCSSSCAICQSKDASLIFHPLSKSSWLIVRKFYFYHFFYRNNKFWSVCNSCGVSIWNKTDVSSVFVIRGFQWRLCGAGVLLIWRSAVGASPVCRANPSWCVILMWNLLRCYSLHHFHSYCLQ